jgi:deoxyribonuclease (pyrimidine dimer)
MGLEAAHSLPAHRWCRGAEPLPRWPVGEAAMTRINCVPPIILSDRHLLAEHHELPRVFGLARMRVLSGNLYASMLPGEYTLGRGHVLFFYCRLKWLRRRFFALREEMRARGMQPSVKEPYLAEELDERLQGDWAPTPEAIQLNLERIALRLSEARDRRAPCSVSDQKDFSFDRKREIKGPSLKTEVKGHAVS